MGDFTDKDRETQVKTLAVLEGHIQRSDERHSEMKVIVKDHENRIRKNEGIVIKITAVYSFVTLSIGAFLTTLIRKNM